MCTHSQAADWAPAHGVSALSCTLIIVSACAHCAVLLLQLFETGVDEMSWDDLSQSRNDWPTIRECHAYRRTAYDIILKLLEVREGPSVFHLRPRSAQRGTAQQGAVQAAP